MEFDPKPRPSKPLADQIYTSAQELQRIIGVGDSFTCTVHPSLKNRLETEKTETTLREAGLKVNIEFEITAKLDTIYLKANL